MEYKQIIRDLMNSILIADPKTEIGGIPITEDSINDIIAESKVWTEDSREFYIEELKTIAKENDKGGFLYTCYIRKYFKKQ